MAAIERITVTMPAAMVASLKATIAEGHYASTSEIVREALRDWTRARDTEQQELKALRDAVRIGDDSGPSVPANEVYDDLRRRIAMRRVNDA